MIIYSKVMVVNGVVFTVHSTTATMELALDEVEALLKDNRSAYVVALHSKKWLVYARPLTEYEEKFRARKQA